jgi:HD-GYP domain-containing protein (c-di-GMP phosphodiesterase class II)
LEIQSKFAKRLRAEIQMPIADLRIGMFVSKPDCGWHRTPFMLEGLLIRDVNEISTLARFAKNVVVDPRRSQLKSFDNQYQAQIYESIPTTDTAIKKIAGAPVSSSAEPVSWKIWKLNWRRSTAAEDNDAEIRKVKATNAFSATSSIAHIMAGESDNRFKQYLFAFYDSPARPPDGGLRNMLPGWINAIAGMFTRRDRQSKRIRPSPSKAKPSYIPANVQLVIYPDAEPTHVSIPKVKTACDHVEDTLRRIVNDISERGLSNIETLREAADTVVDNMITRPDTMMWVAKMRAYSDARYQQALSVAIHLTALGRQIGFQREQLADLAGIGLLLDMGKVTIDPSVLNKPSRLNQFEIEIIRTHVHQGLKMFGESGNLPQIMTRAIAEHHERVDGTGYPNGLGGNDISVYGKMAAIADSFVAMVNPRPYAPTYTAYDAIRQLFRESDSRWYRPLVEQFVQSIGIFPVGSLVELSTGEVSIVVQHNRMRRMEPKVLVVTTRNKSILDRPWDLDILKHNQNAVNSEIRIIKGVADGAYGIDFRNYYLSAK